VTRDSRQASWLRDALARSTAPYKWVLFHHPPFSSGPHGSTAELQWPFRAWGATAVFSGHDHDYERLDVGGMPYVVVGTGGKTLYPFGAPVAGSVERIAQHGALRIDVTRAAAAGEFVSAVTPDRDRFALPASSQLAAPRARAGSCSTASSRSRAGATRASTRARGPPRPPRSASSIAARLRARRFARPATGSSSV
jgi:hypothetical protein